MDSAPLGTSELKDELVEVLLDLIVSSNFKLWNCFPFFAYLNLFFGLPFSFTLCVGNNR